MANTCTAPNGDVIGVSLTWIAPADGNVLVAVDTYEGDPLSSFTLAVKATGAECVAVKEEIIDDCPWWNIFCWILAVIKWIF